MASIRENLCVAANGFLSVMYMTSYLCITKLIKCHLNHKSVVPYNANTSYTASADDLD